jgi:hypothetical protein
MFEPVSRPNSLAALTTSAGLSLTAVWSIEFPLVSAMFAPKAGMACSARSGGRGFEGMIQGRYRLFRNGRIGLLRDHFPIKNGA